MRKNDFSNNVISAVYQHCNQIQQEFAQIFSDDNLNSTAQKLDFIKRTRKMTGSSFIKTLVFNEEDHEHLSLLDLKCDIYEHSKYHISQEAIHKHFTPEAVSFLKAVFSQLLSLKLSPFCESALSTLPFSAILIKDSTKFKLPISFQENYPSYGGYSKNLSLMNLQYEFDLISGNWNSLELTKATRNDQTDSKETAMEIKKGSLNIRDLGYITPTYLKGVDKNEAYYINRLPKIGIYQLLDDSYVPIDWVTLDKEIKEKMLSHLELEVYLGEKDKIKTRLILVPVPDSVAQERIRKAQQGGKRSGGYQLSKEYKIKARYNIFISNVSQDILSINQVVEAYKLRWQIELVFKTWKSNLNIHKIKTMKKERMECQLIAKLIWILMNSKIFQIANNVLKINSPGIGCSSVKFYKQAKKFSQALRFVIVNNCSISKWFIATILPIIPNLLVEKRMKKVTHHQTLYNTIFGLS